jgi:hypothetical protein
VTTQQEQHSWSAPSTSWASSIPTTTTREQEQANKGARTTARARGRTTQLVCAINQLGDGLVVLGTNNKNKGTRTRTRTATTQQEQQQEQEEEQHSWSAPPTS